MKKVHPGGGDSGPFWFCCAQAEISNWRTIWFFFTTADFFNCRIQVCQGQGSVWHSVASAGSIEVSNLASEIRLCSFLALEFCCGLFITPLNSLSRAGLYLILYSICVLYWSLRSFLWNKDWSIKAFLQMFCSFLFIVPLNYKWSRAGLCLTLCSVCGLYLSLQSWLWNKTLIIFGFWILLCFF